MEPLWDSIWGEYVEPPVVACGSNRGLLALKPYGLLLLVISIIMQLNTRILHFFSHKLENSSLRIANCALKMCCEQIRL